MSRPSSAQSSSDPEFDDGDQFPLPGGEGQGEGELSSTTPTLQHSSTPPLPIPIHAFDLISDECHRGYAIECILKSAVTCNREDLRLPQELETHDWDRLLSATGMKRSLESEPAMHTVYSELADRWGPELRYLAKLPRSEDTEKLYEKLTVLYGWIEDHAV